MRLIDEAERAVFRQDYGLVKRMLRENPELARVCDADGRPLLMLIALEEHPNLEVINLLIDAGSDIQRKDKQQQWTTLHFAARDQNADLVKLLLKRGADVDAVDSFGNTPLWRAAMNFRGDTRTIEALIRSNANPDKKNHHGVSPRDLVRDINDAGLKELFRSQTTHS